MLNVMMYNLHLQKLYSKKCDNTTKRSHLVTFVNALVFAFVDVKNCCIILKIIILNFFVDVYSVSNHFE